MVFLTVLCSELDEFWTREKYWGLGRKWWIEETILYYAIYIAMLVSEEKEKSRMLICISVSENLWPISDSIRSLIVWRRF